MGGISFLIGTCAIPLNSILSLIRAKYWLIELLSGVLIPIAFFPKALQILSAWLPFEHIAYTPLQIYLGKLSPADALLAVGVVLDLGGAAAVWPVTCGGIAPCRRSPFTEAKTVFARIERSLRRHAALLGQYFTQYLKVRVSHRGDFLIGVATSMAATVFALGFVLVLFRNVPRLADWRFDEVLFLYGFSLIPFGIFNVLSVRTSTNSATNTSWKASSIAC